MFSKMSVIGHPTSTPTEYGVMPAAATVSRTSVSWSQVSGGSTPASSNDGTAYQIVDLLAPFQNRPYCVPSIAPTSATDSPKLSTIASRRLSIGLMASCPWKSLIRPGCAIAARSGGLPPSTAVESSGARLSPPDVYLTVTFG